MPTVRGYAAPRASAKLTPFSFERRALRDDDVAIAIKFCGVCHTDIHLTRDAWGMSVFPMVPGHEITGVVTAVGSKVTRFAVGDRVGVGCFVDSCTTCSERDVDLEQYRPGLVLTYNTVEPGSSTPTHGGYSESIVVKEGYVLSLPDRLPLDAAAPMLCAGITMYSPLRRWKIGPCAKVAIIGMGGLGHLGVRLAHAMGAEVTVLGRSLSKQEDALRLGAARYVVTSGPHGFEALAGTFDLILSTVSADLDWNAYLALLKIDGAFVTLGVPDKAMTVSPFPLIVGRRNLSGSYMGSIKETQEMLEFCGKHSIVADIETIDVDRVDEAFERVLASDVRYRFVIDIASAF
jgi:alcohol dehydrogenase (NADP+)